MKIKRSRLEGAFTLVEFFICVCVVVVLMTLMLPALRLRHRGSRINCTNNLKQLGLGFRQWAIDHGDKFPMEASVNDGGTMELVGSGVVYPHFRVMSNELNTPKILVCPEDTKAGNEMGKLIAAHVLAQGTNRGYSPPFFPTNLPVSYFVGVDANTNQRAMFLSGDANLAVGGKPAKSGLLSLWTNSPVTWAKPLRPYHGEGGNIVLTDGQVYQGGNVRLRELLTESGVATNRLAIP